MAPKPIEPKPPGSLQEFIDIIHEAAPIMEKQLDELHTNLERLQKLLEPDPETLDDREKKRILGLNDKIKNRMCKEMTLFLSSILVGDYFYSIHYDRKIRKELAGYVDCENNDHKFSKAMKRARELHEAFYRRFLGMRVKKMIDIKHSPVGTIVSFPPLIPTLICYYLPLDSTEEVMIRHCAQFNLAQGSGRKAKYDEPDSYWPTQNKIHYDMFPEEVKLTLLPILKRITEQFNRKSKGGIHKKLSTFIEKLDAWHKRQPASLENGKLPKESTDLIDASVALWIEFLKLTMEYRLVCSAAIDRLCGTVETTEIYPLDEDIE